MLHSNIRKLPALFFAAVLVLSMVAVGVAPVAAATVTADMSIDSSISIEEGDTVAFDLSNQYTPTQGEGLEWDFDGDGTTDYTDALSATASHTYSTAGTYTVTVDVSDAGGVIDTYTITVIVESPNSAATVTADMSIDSSISIEEGDTVSATYGSPTFAPVGSTESFSWDFNGDGTEDATGTSADYTYTTAGTYTASVIYSIDGVEERTESLTVVVGSSGNAPTVSFESPADNQTFSVGEEIPIMITGGNAEDSPKDLLVEYAFYSSGNILYSGAADVVSETAWAYEREGTYTMTATVTDTSGATATAARTVVVGTAPDGGAPPEGGDYSGSDSGTSSGGSSSGNLIPYADAGGPYETTAGTPVTLDASGSSDDDGTIAAYAWDTTGDGTYDATGATVAFNESLAGKYPVTLKVTDDGGATDTETVFVDVLSDSGDGTADVTFNVTDDTNESVANATVEVTDSSGSTVVHSTDENGTVTVSLNDGWTYSYTISYGDKSASGSVAPDSGDATTTSVEDSVEPSAAGIGFGSTGNAVVLIALLLALLAGVGSGGSRRR